MALSTPITRLLAHDRQAGLAELVAVIDRCDGCILRIAHDLAMQRRQLYRILYREQLWDVVNDTRERVTLKAKQGPEWLRHTRAALRRK
jgi:hypothetical protein